MPLTTTYHRENGRVFKNTTLRQDVHVSLGGSKLRLKISNSFNENDLSITAVTVAFPDDSRIGGSAIKPDTVHTVTFSGEESVTVPPNGLETSDPIDLSVDNDSNLTVSMFYLSAVDVLAPYAASTLVIIGDSITDGKGSTLNGNNRWPDQLFPILQSAPSTNTLAIANRGIDGNRVLRNGVGPRALDRFGSDVGATSSVGALLIYEGINDIRSSSSSSNDSDDSDDPNTTNNTATALIRAYTQLLDRARAHDVPRVYIATLAPFGGTEGWNDAQEAARQRVNRWIRRNEAGFDAVVDFDAVLRGGKKGGMAGTGPRMGMQGAAGAGQKGTAGQALRPGYSSDKLHPNVAGYEAMARAVAGEAFGLGW
ncbi:Extracellular GDSL-like lipase/acylhydrolase [Lasiodiplodia theobromae]|uniref:Extracellular GDSL-like lipase/acylhydrolase n=1 Tax=Lasiodiplodia theobromae TaxID=45133 RepID=UPI0015C3A1D2|nr:Extracellular GDSL-like lipase/acylhydrolase [Lasiodiplodia theobromae]KAF4534705.1 Extracellular GDSL-like lipase/acylhydrolase [Lasiodiplodia theobromae]